MQALPDPQGGPDADELTGVSCPDCPGVLAIEHADDGRVRFRCRIGHVYSLVDLLAGKEARLDHALWAVITALDELSTLLRDVVAHGAAIGAPDEYEARAARARQQIEMLRTVIEQNEPVVLGSVATTDDAQEP